MSIKTSKMVLAAGVSALALMVMSSHVVAQEVTIDPAETQPVTIELSQEPPECGFEYELGLEPTLEPEVIVDPLIIDPVLTPEPVVDPLIIDPVPTEGESEVILIDDGDFGTGEPEVVLGGDETAAGEAVVFLQSDAVEPRMLDTASAQAVVVTAESSDFAKSAVSAQERVADASAVPNLCDTASGQKNKFFCGSYSKK